MKNEMAPNIPLAIVLLAAVAAAALRAAARRPGPRRVPGTEPAPVTVTADGSRPRPAVTTCTRDGAGHEMVRPPGPPGRPASAVEQMQHIFHELHAAGRNALCAVCDGQYGSVCGQLPS
jgi:hypothetical protein